MNLLYIPHLIGSLVTIILVLLILANNQKNSINLFFSLASLAVAMYIFFLVVKYNAKEYEAALFWERMVQYAAIFVTPFYYHCTLAIRKIYNPKTSQKFLFFSYSFVIFFVIMNALGFLVPELNNENHNINFPDFRYRILFLSYVLSIGLIHLLTIYNSFILYKKEEIENKKKRYFWLFIALSIGFFGCLDFLPYMLELKSWYPLGAFFPLIGEILATYIFLNYNVDRYNRVIKKKSLLSLFNILILAIYLIIVFLIFDLLHYQINLLPAILLILPIFLHYLFHEKIRDAIILVITRTFFKNQKSYSQIIGKYSNDLLSILDKDMIIFKTLSLLKEQFALKNCFLFISLAGKSNVDCFELSQGVVKKREKDCDRISLLFQASLLSNEPFIPENMRKLSKKDKMDFNQLFVETKTSLCIPLFFKDKLMGAINLGERESDEIYTDEDLNLLKVIGANFSIALHNSKNIQIEIDKIEVEKDNLKKELTEIKNHASFKNIITQDETLLKIMKVIHDVAKTDATVLIYGESGTGKELLARAIHENSNRAKERFIAINCAAIPSELLESELFGYEKGAFSGAYKNYKGKFEEAHEGTLFLDEIEDIKLEHQAKILRVIQDKKIEKLGSSKSIQADFRIIAATNKNLEELITQNLFRKDLYYRLNMVPIQIPPLRERKGDIRLLVSYFLKKYSELNHSEEKKISNDALAAFMNYSWPGNVRELENLIHSLILIHKDSKIIELSELPDKIAQNNSFLTPVPIPASALNGFPLKLKGILENYEKEIIEKAFIQSDKNQNKTARNLSLNLSVLQYKLKKYDIK